MEKLSLLKSNFAGVACIALFFLILMYSSLYTVPILAAEERGTLDGVGVMAVEEYVNTEKNEISLTLGIFPFNPYHKSFAPTVSFLHLFSKDFGWEVAHLSYHFTVDTDLRQQLADNFGVTPQAISRARFGAFTNLLYVFSFGKLLSFDSYLRYFRVAFLAGFGLFSETKANFAAANVGVKFDMPISDSFTIRMDVRDAILLNGFKNVVSFHFGTGYHF